MAIDSASPRSRRALLAAAAAGALGAFATRIGAPGPAAAASAPMLTETTNFTAATTWVEGTSDGFEVFRVKAPGQAPALQAESATGAGVVGSSGGAGLGVLGFSSSGFGAGAISIGGTGLFASSELGLPAVQPGVAILAHVADKTRTGIRGEGRVVFPDRSGRIAVPRGKSYVDVDLRAKGGLGGTPLCFANLLRYRSGVSVAAVRPNYPSTGRMRIYLTKPVRSRTYVAWLVLG